MTAALPAASDGEDVDVDEGCLLMPEPTPRKSPDEAVDEAYEKEAEALMKAQRLRFVLGMSFAAAVGFGAGAFTTYKIACSLRPRR